MNWIVRTFIYSFPKRYQYAVIAAGILVISAVWLITCETVVPWYLPGDFYPIHAGVRLLIRGQNPYTENIWFHNPPWAALALWPFSVLPLQLGGHLNSLFGFFVFAFVALRLKASPLTAIAVLLSAPVVTSVFFSNIDWIPALGLILPPQIGLFFVLIKPQIGIGIAAYWMMEAYQNGGIRSVIKTFLPVSLAFFISFVIYGLYPLRSTWLFTEWYNASMWPASIPVGLVLLVYALRVKQFGLAVIAGGLLANYISINSWSIALLSLLPQTTLTLVASFGYWIYFTLRPVPGTP